MFHETKKHNKCNHLCHAADETGGDSSADCILTFEVRQTSSREAGFGSVHMCSTSPNRLTVDSRFELTLLRTPRISPMRF